MTELKGHLQSLAVKKVLKECINSLEIKKVLPPFMDLPHYDQMPVALFNWNSGLDQRRRTSMVQHNILLKLVSLKSLEQQKTAVDYQQLILLLEKLLLSFDEKDEFIKTLEILDTVKMCLNTLNKLKQESTYLQQIRRAKLNDEVGSFDYRYKKSELDNSLILLQSTSHPMAALIHSDIKKKYYKQIHMNINEQNELAKNDIENQINYWIYAIRREQFCGEQVVMTYKGQSYHYSHRLEKLTKIFDEERTKIEDELAAKILEKNNMQLITNTLYKQMQVYRQKVEEFKRKYPTTEEKAQTSTEDVPASQARSELLKALSQEKKKKKLPKVPIEEKFKEVPVYEGESKLEGLKDILHKKYKASIKKVEQKNLESKKILKRALKVYKE